MFLLSLYLIFGLYFITSWLIQEQKAEKRRRDIATSAGMNYPSLRLHDRVSAVVLLYTIGLAFWPLALLCMSAGGKSSK